MLTWSLLLVVFTNKFGHIFFSFLNRFSTEQCWWLLLKRNNLSLKFMFLEFKNKILGK